MITKNFCFGSVLRVLRPLSGADAPLPYHSTVQRSLENSCGLVVVGLE